MKKKNINPQLSPGDRIILIHMKDEGYIDVGTKGKVLKVSQAPKFSKDDLGYMYDVEWYDDNGKVFSHLSLIPEEDSWIFDTDINIEINEININSMEDLEMHGNMLQYIKKSELKIIFKYLKLIAKLGITNMFQSGDFLGITKQYFEDYMRLKSYEREYDEDLVNEISDMVDEVRNIIISIAIKKVEGENKEVSIDNVRLRMNQVIRYLVRYYIEQ